MPKPSRPTNPQPGPRQRRIWSDPFFYGILGTIGATYVLLVIGMLGADAAYIFTSDITQQVRIDFATGAKTDQYLQVGEIIDDQFADYGLTITTDDPARHPPRILNSSRPTAENSDVGTPHQSFGGPGFGSPAKDGKRHSNSMPLGNVLVIGSHANKIDFDTDTREVIHTWARPVTLSQIRVVPANRSASEVDDDASSSSREVALAGYLASGDVERETFTLDEKGGGKTSIDWQDVIRLDARLPNKEASVEIDYALTATAAIATTGNQTDRFDLGNARLVPLNAGDITPHPSGGVVSFRWEDPVSLSWKNVVDSIKLLDVDKTGGTISAYNDADELIEKWSIKATGANTVQTISLQHRHATKQDNEATPDVIMPVRDVARLDVALPCGAAIAEVSFNWQRRVRTAWQRDHPLLARVVYNQVTFALQKPEIRYSIWLTLISCTISAILSLWVAIPIGYLLARHNFWGRSFIDALLDIPIVLPPLVVGLSLLILLQYFPASLRGAIVYEKPAVVLAQFAVACAFAVRTMRATFDQIDPRREQVALTLGCSRLQAFGLVVLPESNRGIVTALTLAWARSLGEFGPLLILAGVTRNKTEVLSSTVYLEISTGDLGAAVAVSLIMVAAAITVLILARFLGTRKIAI